MLTSITRLAVSHPRRLAAAVGIFFVIALAIGSGASSVLTARNDFVDPGAQSAEARTTIEHATGAAPAPGVLALVRERPGGPAVRRAAALLAADPGIARVAPATPAANGRTTLLAATARAGTEEKVLYEGLKSRFAHDPQVVLGGAAIAGPEVGNQAASDLGLAEALAFPLLALLAFLIFRGTAALLPLAVGAVSVFTSFALLVAVNTGFHVSVFALNLVIGIGLGLAVDYSLFMVSRFREEVAAGRDVAEAVTVTMRTAGRTVAFSAVTVAVAMSSLTVFPLRFLQSMGIGGMVTALSAAGAALTLLPAAFMLFGRRLGRATPGPANDGRWYRLAHAVLRRPGLVAAVTASALIVMALPALKTHWSGVDARVLPASASAHVVESELERHYPSTAASPGFIAVRAGADQGPAVAAYAARLAAVGATTVSLARYVGDSTWQITTVTRDEAISPAAQRIVEAERSVAAPFEREVGGFAAEFHDQRTAIASNLPLALAILAIGTLFVLWLMTDSVVLPVKALAMNALTVGAATGILVLIFQDGRFTGLLDYVTQKGIEQSDYLVLAAIAFALSTDYGVFLLTRIKEAHDAGETNEESIAIGLQRTGGIVTAAAILLAVAIGAFATSQVVFLKEIGVGAVAAVLIDAFIIRSLLVPALMGLLGRWNWWSPAALHRLHERFGVNENGAGHERQGEVGVPALQS